MKKFISTILVLTTVMFCGNSYAQTIKIAQINSQEVLAAMPEMEQVQKDLEAYGMDLTSTMETSQVEYNKMLEEYVNQRDSLTEVARMAKEQDLTDRRDRLTQFQENAQQLYAAKQQELMRPIIEKVQTAISDVSKSQGLTWVIDLASAGVAYVADDAPDITKEVLAKLGISK